MLAALSALTTLETSMDHDLAECAVQIVMCAWCRRLKSPSGAWLVGIPTHDNISHGICPECLEKMKAERRAA